MFLSQEYSFSFPFYIQKFTLTYFCDDELCQNLKKNPLDVECYDNNDNGLPYKYIRMTKGETVVQSDYICLMGNYVESSAIKCNISPRLKNYILDD